MWTFCVNLNSPFSWASRWTKTRPVQMLAMLVNLGVCMKCVACSALSHLLANSTRSFLQEDQKNKAADLRFHDLRSISHQGQKDISSLPKQVAKNIKNDTKQHKTTSATGAMCCYVASHAFMAS